MGGANQGAAICESTTASMDVESLSLPFIFSTSVSKYTDCHLQRVLSASGMWASIWGGVTQLGNDEIRPQIRALFSL